MRFEQLEGCTWEPMADVGAKSCEHVGEETITQCEDEDDWSSVGLESCRSEQAGLSSVRAVRLGPFFSLPGQWRSLSTYTLRGLLGDGDRNLILRHRQGWRERFDGLMTDVVLPGPIIFWSLHLADLLGWPPVHVPRP